MNLKIALQIDPLATLNLERDTSLLLAYEAQQRGYFVSYFHASDLSYTAGKLSTAAHKLELVLTNQIIVPHQGDTHPLNLSEIDVVLMRQNPPFDMSYITNTFLLDQATHHTLVLNHPTSVRNSAEKLLPLEFPDFIPPTLISQNWDDIDHFQKKHSEVVLKPLFDFGGRSVFRLKRDSPQLKSVVEDLLRTYPALPIIVQPFLEQVIEGDKRLILIDGELIGGYTRVPQSGDFRSNQLMGATVKKCEVSARDSEICQRVGARLRKLGLFLAGIDIIGDYLIEINVTSPTGLVALNQLNHIQAEQIFWDKAEHIIKTRGKPYYRPIPINSQTRQKTDEL